MNVNRVTLRALGTTGVLLAASLTMLAMVSALVTFDAWPTRSGQASASQIQVQPAPAAPVVRTVRHTRTPASVLAARRSGSPGVGGRGGLRFGGGAVAQSGGGAAPAGTGGNGGSSHLTPPPSPTVTSTSPGESGGGGPPEGPKQTPQPTLLHSVTCNATSTVSGAAGGTVHSSC
jgi:hypothetical protein